MEWLTEAFTCCETKARSGRTSVVVEAQRATPPARVGVGIAFDSEGAGEGKGLRVNHVRPNSPAYHSHRIKAGDYLVSIDNEDVRTMNPGQLGPLILGEKGTRVKMEFERSDPQSSTSFEVVLERAENRY